MSTYFRHTQVQLVNDAHRYADERIAILRKAQDKLRGRCHENQCWYQKIN
jgi:hypothetical protein